MKSYKAITVSGYIIVIMGVMLLGLSYLKASFAIFFVGCAVTILGFLAVISLMTLKLFLKDKELDLENLRAMGLTIVTCKKCERQNVLEDQYCIYCGEELKNDNPEV